MARTLLDFAKSLEARAAAVGSIGNEATKRKAFAIVRYLAYHTPVDTSKALSNWQVGIGAPVGSVHGAFFIGVHGSTKTASAENTVNFAQAMLERKRPGETVYISNLLPYIQRLNDGGHSQQPGGFVEVATLLARTTK